MSIRKRIFFNLSLSVFFALLLFGGILLMVSWRLVGIRIKETYQLVYSNYREILYREEKTLRSLPEEALSQDIYVKRRLPREPCPERAHYRILPTGPYYGVGRKYRDQCYFVGVSLEEVLRFTGDLLSADWVVYYERVHLKNLLEMPLEDFIKDKVTLGHIVVDRFSNQKVLSMPLVFRDYALHNGLVDKILLVGVSVTDAEGLPVGRVVLIKDVSYIHKEVYRTVIALALYSLLIMIVLVLSIFRVISQLTDRIISLKNITSRLEERDFSAVELLDKSKDPWQDEVSQLAQSVHHMAVSLKVAFEELHKRQDELEQLAYYDPLTGLPNRRFFFNHARLLLESSRRYGTPLSLLLIDIDNFKKINDNYGHEAGDMVLKSFADIFKRNTRQSDLVARVGGEEFALLMPNTDLQQGKAVAERIRREFENTVVVYQEKDISATLSGGLVSFSPDIEDIDELLRRADRALYTAKELGRNRIEVLT